MVAKLAEHAVAAWASREISIGNGMSLFPRVVGYEDVPAIIEPIATNAQPELSILSALAHINELPVVRTALDELRRLPEDEQHVYFDILDLHLPESLRRTVMDFKNYEFKSEFALKNRAAGRQEGRQEGREEGREEGRRQVLRTQIVKKFGMSEANAEKRLARLDETQLLVLIERILSAMTLEALFDGVE